MYFWQHFLKNSKSEIERRDRIFHVIYPLGFALRATTQHVGNAGGLQLLCCQGFEVKNYDVTLNAWNLKPSNVCNVGVKSIAVGNRYFSANFNWVLIDIIGSKAKLGLRLESLEC